MTQSTASMPSTADSRGHAVAVHHACVGTPLGTMIAAASDRALLLLEFVDHRGDDGAADPASDRGDEGAEDPASDRAPAGPLDRLARRIGATLVAGENDVIARTRAELDAYFRGELRRFTIALEPAGTDFQRAVWHELTRIGYGETRSYAAQARAIGRADAVRAVARANGDNPIAIVVPCHRVVGSDGSLTGYGGGLWRKRRLLDLEQGVTALF